MNGGINKAGRLADEAAAAREKLARETASLDPPFPFLTQSFDPIYFQLPANPRPIIKPKP
jgi:hypothetical protein